MRFSTDLRKNTLITNVVAYIAVALVFNTSFAGFIVLMGLPVDAIVLIIVMSLLGLPLFIVVLKQQIAAAAQSSSSDSEEDVWLLDRPIVQIAQRPSIAVLPFWTEPSDPAAGIFALGITQEVAVRMTAETNFFITGRNSCCTYQNQQPSLAQVAEELGVRHVLMGELKRLDGKLHVIASLWHTQTGREVWTIQVTSGESNPFDLVAEIFARVGSTLSGALHAWDAQRILRHEPAKPESWIAYVEASALFRTDQRDNHPKCIELCRQSIALDAEFARPRALLAFAIAVRLAVGAARDPIAAAKEAMAEAEAALLMAPTDPEVTSYVAQSLSRMKFHDRAFQVARSAALMAPDSVCLAIAIGTCKIALGNAEAGIIEMRRALRFSPVDEELSLWLLYVAVAFTISDDFDQAVKHARAAINRRPDTFLSWLVLANALALQGDTEDACAAIERSQSIFPSLSPSPIVDRWQTFFAEPGDAAKMTAGLEQIGYAQLLSGRQ